MISRVLQWLWFEATTEVWSPTMAARGLAPSLRWACTGRDADARREAYSPAEAFRAGMREAELEALRFELGEVRATYERSLADARAEVNRLRAEARAERERLRAAPGQPAVGAAPKIDAATWPEAHDGVTEPPIASQISIDLVASLRRAGWTPEVTWLDPVDGYRWSEGDEYDMAHLRGVASGAVSHAEAVGASPVAERPPLAAGQRWRDHSGAAIVMRKRTDISAGFNLDAVYPSEICLQFNAGEHAPDGWTFLGTVEPRSEPAPALHIERRGDGEYLVGAEEEGGCHATDDGWICRHHLDGMHLATFPDGDAECIGHRWPIAAEPGEPPAEEPDARWRPGAVWERAPIGANYADTLIVNSVSGEDVSFVDRRACERRADMTEANGWRCVGQQKPAVVEPGQVWRCVGIEGEIVVWTRDSITGPGEAALFPVDSGGTYGRIRARASDMLGLAEWTFVRALPAPRIVHDSTAGQWWEPVHGADGKGRVLRPVEPDPGRSEDGGPTGGYDPGLDGA